MAVRVKISARLVVGVALSAGAMFGGAHQAVAGMAVLDGRHALSYHRGDRFLVPVQGLSLDDLKSIEAGIEGAQTSPPVTVASPPVSAGNPAASTNVPSVVPFDPGAGVSGDLGASVPASKLPLTAPPPTTAAPVAVPPSLEQMMGVQPDLPPPEPEMKVPEMAPPTPGARTG